jgi:hypothetical protein
MSVIRRLVSILAAHFGGMFASDGGDGTPHGALLCQGCVNRFFKPVEQSHGFWVGKRQDLHQDDSGYAPVEIDPETGIS